MTYIQIIENYLKRHKIGGLANHEINCACLIGDILCDDVDSEICLPASKEICENIIKLRTEYFKEQQRIEEEKWKNRKIVLTKEEKKAEEILDGFTKEYEIPEEEIELYNEMEKAILIFKKINIATQDPGGL